MSSIFISHSSRDNGVAQEVKQRLQNQGHRSVFLDFDPAVGIPAGRNWERELYTKLRQCRAVIILCSQHSMSSFWCFAEITHAKALGKQIFPLKLDNCKLVGLLTDVQTINLTTGQEEAYQRLWQGLLAAGLDPRNMFDWDINRPPYPGLMTFEEQDAAIFCGRDSDIGVGIELLNRLQSFGGKRLCLVLGASGSGKSSLVRAGMLPRLKRNKRSWLVVEPFRPLENPLAELSKVLAHCFERYEVKRDWQEIREQLELCPNAVKPDISNWLNLAQELQAAAGQSKATILLVIDQMEELLSFAPEQAANQFVPFLRTVLEDENNPFMVIGTLRSDFLGAFQENPALRGVSFESLPVGAMGIEKLAQVITGPAAVAGIELGEGLVTAMVNDTKTEDALPLLAFSLQNLWLSYGEDGRLEKKDYEDLGKLEGSISRVAENELDAGVSPQDPCRKEVEQQLQAAFLKLVWINQEGKYARRKADWTHMPAGVRSLLERFVKARLLVSSGDEQERFLEVSHEALFSSWPRLRGWLETDRDFLLWRNRLNEARLAWEQSSGDEGALLRGALLEQAEKWYGDRQEVLSQPEQDFIRQSLLLQNREKKEKERQDREKLEAQVALDTAEEKNQILDKANQTANRRIRVGSAFLAVSLLGAIIAAVMAGQALHRQQEAQEGTQLERAGVSALQQFDNSQIDALLSSIHNGKQLKALVSNRPLAQYPAFSPLLTLRSILDKIQERNNFKVNTDYLDRSQISPNGKLLAVMGSQQLWDTSGKLLAEFKPIRGDILDIFFSPDSKLLVANGNSGIVHIWDASGKLVAEFNDPQRELVNIQFSPDSKLLATYSDYGLGNTVHLWNTSGKLVAEVKHPQGVKSIEFNPNGNLLVILGNDGTVSWWNTAGRLVTELKDDRDNSDVKFSPDGKLLATIGQRTRIIRLWNIYGKQVMKFKPVQGLIRSMQFSPDSKLLVVQSNDISDNSTIQLWSISGNQVAELKDSQTEDIHQHFNENRNIMFSPDSKLLATIGSNSIAHVWDTSKGIHLAEFRHPQGLVNSVEFIAINGNLLLATKGTDNTIRLWNTSSGQQVMELGYFQFQIEKSAFSSDSKLLTTIETNGTVRTWDTNKPIAEFNYPRIVTTEKYRGIVDEVKLSPDGNLLLTNNNFQDNLQFSFYLWNVSGQPLAKFKDISTVWFSPDSKLIASIESDTNIGNNIVRLWKISGQKVAELKHCQGEDKTWVNMRRFMGSFNVPGCIDDLQFSSDSKQIVTRNHATAYLWKTSGEKIAQFDPFTQDSFGSISSVQFSSDNKLLVFSNEVNGIVSLWDTSGHKISQFKHPPDTYTNINELTEGKFKLAVRSNAQLLATSVDNPKEHLTRLWNTSGKQVAELKHSQSGVQYLQFSPDGKLLATLESNGLLHIWNTSGRQIASLKHPQDQLQSVQFSPNSKLLATAGSNGFVLLWKSSGELVAEAKHPFGDAVKKMSFSPDGELLVTLDSDNAIRLWSLSGQLIAEFKEEGRIIDFTFNQRNQRLTVISDTDKGNTGTLHSWAVEDLEQLLVRGCYRLKEYLETHPNAAKICSEK